MTTLEKILKNQLEHLWPINFNLFITNFIPKKPHECNESTSKKFHHIMLILLEGSNDCAFGFHKIDFILLHI